MILIDVASHLLISLFIAIVLWPYLGAWGLIVVLIAAGYLIHAWKSADLIAAAKAGFRRPTLVQRRYLEYLGVGGEVFTHPSRLPIAGTLFSSQRRLILLTSGVFQLYEHQELSENDMRLLIDKLSSRDNRAVFGWTFHLATGGARLFSRLDQDDPAAGYWRRTLTTALIGGVYAVIMAVLFAASIGLKLASSGAVHRSIDVSKILPAFWLPFVYLAARFVWRWANAALIKTAAGDWNKPITLEQITFLPMSITGAYPNLNLLRHGLLIVNCQIPGSPELIRPHGRKNQGRL
ncbi:MAG: hypothetical protein Q8L35_06470 [Actinomycetota bacterium]|nr:hypothetical protein [Actinomycetota bacterium]